MIVNDLMAGDLGVFNGMPIVENSWLPYDAVLVDTFAGRVVVGEVAHLRYLFRLHEIRLAAIADVDEILNRLASSLGVR